MDPAGIHFLRGEYAPGPEHVSDYTESGRWPTTFPWAKDPWVIRLFAKVHHNIAQLRTRYPHLILYVDHPEPPSPGQGLLPRELFQRYSSAKVATRLGVNQFNGGFAVHERANVHLFEVGSGDYTDFGGMVDLDSGYNAILLLSRQPVSLREVKAELEAISEPGEGPDDEARVAGRKAAMDDFYLILSRRFGAIFGVDGDGFFLLTTRDTDLVEAFLRKGKPRDKYPGVGP